MYSSHAEISEIENTVPLAEFDSRKAACANMTADWHKLFKNVIWEALLFLQNVFGSSN